MKPSSALAVSCFVLFSTLFMAASGPRPANPPDGVAGLQSAPCPEEPCNAVARGLHAFLDRRLDGLGSNGRACADCHMISDHFQLSPENVEKRFQQLEADRLENPDADDPLFRPIDADDFRTNGDAANEFRNLRENGLIRIAFPLPPNIRLIDPATNAPSAETETDVWRSVPTVNDVALTGPDSVNPWPRGPNHFGGYQLDARVGTLQEQALGALTHHAQVQNAPPQQLLDDLAAFQLTLFTNPRVQELSEAAAAGTWPLPDPDLPLTPLQQEGKVVFERACTQCHGGPGQSNAQAPAIRYHDISTQCPRPVDPVTPARFVFAACPARLARNARIYEITLPSGARIRRTSSDPGRALSTGFVGGPAPLDDWNKFDVPALRGISQRAPYFHNNSAATLEEVVDHYTAFFKRVEINAVPGVIPPLLTTDGVHIDRPFTPDEREALLAYLRKL